TTACRSRESRSSATRNATSMPRSPSAHAPCSSSRGTARSPSRRSRAAGSPSRPGPTCARRPSGWRRKPPDAALAFAGLPGLLLRKRGGVRLPGDRRLGVALPGALRDRAGLGSRHAVGGALLLRARLFDRRPRAPARRAGGRAEQALDRVRNLRPARLPAAPDLGGEARAVL